MESDHGRSCRRENRGSFISPTRLIRKYQSHREFTATFLIEKTYQTVHSDHIGWEAFSFNNSSTLKLIFQSIDGWGLCSHFFNMGMDTVVIFDRDNNRG